MVLQPYNMDLFDRELNQLIESDGDFRSASKQSLVHADAVARLNVFSRYFMGRPYLLGALGEGREGYFDQSPLYRTDAFDCLTYVNTVLALYYADDLDSFKQHMLQLNYYQAEPSYHKRFHFMSADWNVQNRQQGYIKDITMQVVDAQARPVAATAEAKINRPDWFCHRQLSDIKLLMSLTDLQAQSRLAELHVLAQQLESELATLAYVPLTALFDLKGEPDHAIFAQIPHGAIIEIVRPNWDLTQQIGTHLNVSHIGFGFWRQQQPYFRHASIHQYIIEEPLIDYLHRYLDSPTIKGINIHLPEVIK